MTARSRAPADVRSLAATHLDDVIQRLTVSAGAVGGGRTSTSVESHEPAINITWLEESCVGYPLPGERRPLRRPSFSSRGSTSAAKYGNSRR